MAHRSGLVSILLSALAVSSLSLLVKANGLQNEIEHELLQEEAQRTDFSDSDGSITKREAVGPESSDKRYSAYFRSDLGKRSRLDDFDDEEDTLKRAYAMGDLQSEGADDLDSLTGKRYAGFRSDLGKRLAGFRSDLGKRLAGFRSDLGKRMSDLDLEKRYSGFRSDLGKRYAGFRSDLGKRYSGFRSDLGKRAAGLLPSDTSFPDFFA